MIHLFHYPNFQSSNLPLPLQPFTVSYTLAPTPTAPHHFAVRHPAILARGVSQLQIAFAARPPHHVVCYRAAALLHAVIA